MHQRFIRTLLFFLFTFQILLAQKPAKPSASEIYQQIQKVNFLGTVLYVAAHPDDENTRLISYLSNEKKARTGYLSLTRGDGGQNLIGPELRELLGVIRTQELIEARKIDGGEQFFSRANDFGYSKNPEETLRIWDKDSVLSDMVYIIRKFQPDVIINRFDARSPGSTHGHHTASALLSLEAFEKTNDKNSFADQLNLVEPWQTRRLFFNTSWWFYGSKEKFDKADKSNLMALQTGVYYPEIGKSNQEIAALSRSRHQSQGFGSTATRGEDTEYLEFLKGDVSIDKANIFDGIDTSWNRVKGGKAIGLLLSEVEKNYDFKNPSASVNDLANAYKLIMALDEKHWKAIKSEEIKKIIAACSGLYLEAVAQNQESVPRSTIKIKVEAINRSTVLMTLTNLTAFPESETKFQTLELKNNAEQNIELTIALPETIDYTQPYWLKENGSAGLYRVDDQKNIGVPDIIRTIKVTFNILINNINIPFERTVVYKYNDNVKGEVYQPLDIVPDVTSSILDKVQVFKNGKSKSIGIKIKAGKDDVKGTLQLELPENWKINPKSISFSLNKGAEETAFFEVTPPKNGEEIIAKSFVLVNGKRFDKEQTGINYEHISKQQVLKASVSKFIKMDIKTKAEKIAYIMGAGDEVPRSLMQMGYDVAILKPEQITRQNLLKFNVVITGIRAYNTIRELSFKQNILMAFVKEGHTMIVQYNTLDELVTKDFSPYPLKISRDRVTEENAAVRFLTPEHSLLNYPNKISSKDFEGWKQEQGLNYPHEWDAAFTPILSSNDNGEPEKKGILLVAKYGKGHYIYTGLSFFRELPEGVTGAYRLMANMISIKPDK